MDNLEEQLAQALDELHDAEVCLQNCKDHHEQQEAREELLTCSRIVNQLRMKLQNG